MNGGHDPNPGCDLDPRNSPAHDGDDLVSLLSAHRNVPACPDATAWWADRAATG